MRKAKLVVAFLTFLFVGKAYSFDADLAKKFDGMFSQLTPEVVAKKPCEIDSRQLHELMSKDEVVILDIRTPQEMGVVGITYKNALRIPMHELFKEENLRKLPKDKKIVVVCHTGTRAAPVTMALRMIGFDNAFMLKGGMAELASKTGRNVINILK